MIATDSNNVQSFADISAAKTRPMVNSFWTQSFVSEAQTKSTLTVVNCDF